MDLKVKLYGILVTDNDNILLKKDKVLTLPGDNIKIGKDLDLSIKEIIKDKTNIDLLDVLLFDEKSIVSNNEHILGIFFIGIFKKEEIERINQDYNWYKISKLNLDDVDEFSKYIIKQIIDN